MLSGASSMTIELSKIISYLSFASSLMCSISIFVCQQGKIIKQVKTLQTLHEKESIKPYLLFEAE